jgi:ribosomal 50S subunit-associated protein YjgA (DUF615 family)
MNNKLSSVLAVAGLMVITTSANSIKDDLPTKKNKHSQETALIEKINTQKRTIVDEWNAGCAQCKG